MSLIFSPQHECDMQSKYEYHIGLYDYQKVILLNIHILKTNKYVFIRKIKFENIELSKETSPY